MVLAAIGFIGFCFRDFGNAPLGNGTGFCGGFFGGLRA
jgi:hypothetical protein